MKKLSAIFAMIAAAIIIPTALLAWGPSRPTYTTAVPADHITFNSITDNPSHGDERNFVQVRDANSGNETYVDSISLTAGHEYVVYVYFHNNAAANLNLKATGSYVKAQIPAIVSNGSTGTKAVGYVGANNATPLEVWDDISFSNTTGGDIALSYVAGSSTIHSFGAVNGQTMSGSIVTTGAAIGYNALDGIVPGCNEFAGYVTFRVKANQPNFTISKQVHKTGVTGWKETEAVNPGDSVDYLITYKNTGTTTQNDVVISDVLPKSVSYTAGSTYVANTTNPNGLKVSDNITKGGINIGNYAAGAAAYIKFGATVVANNTLPTCGENTLTNSAKVQTANGSKEDTADVTVTKTCIPTPPAAKYTCDKLSVEKISRTSFRFTTDYTVQNATFNKVTYVVSDASGKEVDSKSSSVKTLEYQMNTEGKYSVKSTITVAANGKEFTATSEGCKAEFEVTKVPTTPVTPTVTPPVVPVVTPEELPTTGAGETFATILGLGASITSLGYYLASRRALLSR